MTRVLIVVEAVEKGYSPYRVSHVAAVETAVSVAAVDMAFFFNFLS